MWGKQKKKKKKKKEARVREGEGEPHKIFPTPSPSTKRTLFRLILIKMAYPHMDTKIPLRVVDPPSSLMRGYPPPLRVVDPLPYAWGPLPYE